MVSCYKTIEQQKWTGESGFVRCPVAAPLDISRRIRQQLLVCIEESLLWESQVKNSAFAKPITARSFITYELYIDIYKMLVKYLHKAWETVDCIGEKQSYCINWSGMCHCSFCHFYNLADETDFIQK